MVWSNKREIEAVEDAVAKSMNTWDDMRLMSPEVIGRYVDSQVVNKMRLSLYGQQSKAIAKHMYSSEDYNDMQKARDTWKPAGKGVDARDFDLDQDLAVMYFNFYGHNFEGGDIVDDSSKGWECPCCHLKYSMSLKTLDDKCMRCGWLTPLGEMKRDGAFRR